MKAPPFDMTAVMAAEEKSRRKRTITHTPFTSPLENQPMSATTVQPTLQNAMIDLARQPELSDYRLGSKLAG